MSRFCTLEEVKASRAFAYYGSLGLNEEQAVCAAMIDMDMIGGGYPALLKAFEGRPATDDRTFSRFFCDKVFDPAMQDEELADCEDGAPAPGSVLMGGRPSLMNAVKGVFSRTAAPKGRAMESTPMMMAGSMPPVMDQAMAMPSPAAMPGGARRRELPVMPVSPEDVRTDSYESIEEKGMKSVAVSPTCTFRTTYNTAAATVLLSNIRDSYRTRHSMVRTEEVLNYLVYDLVQPEEAMFAVTPELKRDGNKAVLFLGIQGKKSLPKKQNICFLLDVSGSMGSRSENMMMCLFAVLMKMNEGDIFSLVTYSSRDKVVVNGLKLDAGRCIDDLLHIIAKEVYITGYTDGSAGINKAYEIIEENKVDGVNRVIILTDGDLNFGVHDKDGLKGLISKKKESGAYFSAIGTGITNLQDDKLETLAKNGNGNYFVVNTQEDIEKCVVDRYESLVFPIAKNVKAQMEFNPAVVSRYKLIGYENRMLSHEDFRDDTVIAEPFGSGSYGVALFELEMADGAPADAGLKYQTVQTTGSTEIGTLTLRYEDAEGTGFHELAFPVAGDLPQTANIENAMKASALCAKMRGRNVDELTRNALVRLLEEKTAPQVKEEITVGEFESTVTMPETEMPPEEAEISPAFPGIYMPGSMMGGMMGMGQTDTAPAPVTPGTPSGAAGETWDCPVCGQKANIGRFCPTCGSPKP